ncbi:MAG: cytochrome P460 family protein [Candidatus Poribacteria bacterium]|nr:cytochrome P460 family protein [Candidatus Poribacteria bacterium]MDD9974235.1 cytochrome P460 family protein [Candidatus Poribacteria bacterium]
MLKLKYTRNLLTALAIILLFTACAEKQLDELVQQTEEETTNATETEPVQPEEPAAVALPGLPADVAGYTQWLKLNAAPIPPVPGGDPHNGTKNVYVNQTRDTIAPNGTQQFPYPDGSIVVKDATRPGKDYIGLIAIMRKKDGVDPDHNDWEFIEYVRNAADDEFRVIAKDGVCWGCHARVKDIDYVFTELE